MPARGILAYGAYLPFHRLDRAEIAAVAGSGGGRGTRTVAAYDEDTTTLGVEAARSVLGPPPDVRDIGSLWFATTQPAYADKTNATAIHAALGLDPAVPAFDVNGAVRSALGALRAGLDGATDDAALVVTADVRTGLPGSADEATGGDGAAALLVGPAGQDLPLLAEAIGWGSATAEFLDRWRAPGEARAHLWEERFGEGRYLDLGQRAWDRGLAAARLTADQVDHVVIVGGHGRAGATLAKKLDVAARVHPVVAQLEARVGFTGAAHPALALAATLDEIGPDQVVALVTLADGADVVVLRTTGALAAYCSPIPVHKQLEAAGTVAYGRYLAWRGFLPVEPPRRPEPARPSASAAGRSTAWKFGFVGSQAGDGTVHLPPSPLDAEPRPMAQATGTVATFTVDRMAYSPSPPVVFAVVDFDGGGRAPLELTDVDPARVAIGDRVEMTFRKLFTADGIHNYFWKARPLRTTGTEGGD